MFVTHTHVEVLALIRGQPGPMAMRLGHLADQIRDRGQGLSPTEAKVLDLADAAQAAHGRQADMTPSLPLSVRQWRRLEDDRRLFQSIKAAWAS